MATWSPTPEDIARVFDEQNPWHQTATVARSLAPPVERPLAQVLWKRLMGDDPHRYQLILGPRRVGKSTVMYQTVRRLIDSGIDPRRVWWLRLDHPLLIQQSLGDIVQAIIATSRAAPDQPVYLMLDELVYASEWDLWLKTFYDDRWPLRIAATSSATAALRDRRLESGVGRWAEQHLTPYLLTEYLELAEQPAPIIDLGPTLRDTVGAILALDSDRTGLDRHRRMLMLTGGFPELIELLGDHEPDDESAVLRSQQILRTDAVERAVYKDIPQSFGVDNPMMLERLLYVLAGQMGALVSPTNICRELGMSQPTFDRYLAYLERAFIVFTLPNYSGREATVQRRGRKLYFVDGAVRNAALLRGIAPLGDPVELGALLENLVAASLRSYAAHAGLRLFHWRQGQAEVDLVLDHPTAPMAFEVASSPSHHRKGLRALVERHPHLHGGAYLLAPQAPVLHAAEAESGIGSLPTDALLVALGSQADAAMRANLA